MSMFYDALETRPHAEREAACWLRCPADQHARGQPGVCQHPGWHGPATITSARRWLRLPSRANTSCCSASEAPSAGRQCLGRL